MFTIKKIVLASGSERRKMILEQAGIPFEPITSDVDEESEFNSEVSPYDLVKIISLKKAMSVCEKVDEPCIVIAADTIISSHGKIYGKPKDKNSAYDTLKALQGKDHLVYTGVTLIDKKEDGSELSTSTIVDTTKVVMRKLTEREIWDYIETNEPFDKAGSYAIQEKGMLLIESIEGDYYSVVGLPLVKVYDKLKEFGVDLSKFW